MSQEKRTSFYRKRFATALVSSALAGVMLSFGPYGIIKRTHAEAVSVDAPAAQPGFAKIVDQVSPAVVSVSVKSDKQSALDRSKRSPDFFRSFGFDDLPDNHPLKRFFRDFGGPGAEKSRPDNKQKRSDKHPARARPVSQASGFFISEDGYLVTNNHVISDGDAYSIVLNDGTELEAKLVGTDPRTDLAVLKVDGKRKFAYVAFGDDNKVHVGDWVVAVGNPFGLGGTVTAGIVSARGRDIGAINSYDDFIQIDAAVNRGNSGGPLFSLNGQVVGINTAIFSPSGGSVGIAFAIPASTAQQVVEQLIKNGSVQRGWIGVQIQPVTKEVAESLGLSESKGALVAAPQTDSPAAKAGIKAGDVITAVNGEIIADSRDLARKIAVIAPGQTVNLTVWSKEKAQDIKVTVAATPKEQQQAATGQPSKPSESEALDSYGLTVVPSEDGKGIVVTDVDPDSDAADKGIRSGDMIVSVNNKPVKSVDDINAAIKEASKSNRRAILLQLQNNDQSRFVALPINKG